MEAYKKEGKEFVLHDVPQNYSKEWYNLCVKNKAFIPKEELIKGNFYEGSCRNASWAQWTGEKWAYIRHKWGTEFIDHVEAIEDDVGFDVFIPWKAYTPSEAELEFFKET